MSDGGGRLRYRQRQRARNGGYHHKRQHQPLPPRKGASLWLVGGIGGAAGLALVAASGGLGILPVVAGAIIGYIAGVKAGDALSDTLNRAPPPSPDAAAGDKRRGDGFSARGQQGVSRALTGADCGASFNGTGARLSSAPAAPAAGTTPASRRHGR